MSKSKYTQLYNGDGFDVENGAFLYFACCDCGLVHRFEFQKDDKSKNVKFKMYKEPRRTRSYRHSHGIKVIKHS